MFCRGVSKRKGSVNQNQHNLSRLLMKLTYLCVLFSEELQIWVLWFHSFSVLWPQCAPASQSHNDNTTIIILLHGRKTERERERISEVWILSQRTAVTGGQGMGIVSKTLSEDKEGKQIAHFEISDSNRPIISVRVCLSINRVTYLCRFDCVVSVHPGSPVRGHFTGSLCSNLGDQSSTSQTIAQEIAKRWRHKINLLVPFEEDPLV